MPYLPNRIALANKLHRALDKWLRNVSSPIDCCSPIAHKPQLQPAQRLSASWANHENTAGAFSSYGEQIVNYKNAMTGLGVHLTVMRRCCTTGDVRRSLQMTNDNILLGRSHQTPFLWSYLPAAAADDLNGDRFSPTCDPEEIKPTDADWLDRLIGGTTAAGRCVESVMYM